MTIVVTQELDEIVITNTEHDERGAVALRPEDVPKVLGSLYELAKLQKKPHHPKRWKVVLGSLLAGVWGGALIAALDGPMWAAWLFGLILATVTLRLIVGRQK